MGWKLWDQARELRGKESYSESNLLILQAKSEFEKQHDLVNVLESDRLYARNLAKLGGERKAIDWLQPRLEKAIDELGPVETVGKSYTTLAILYKALGELETAIEFYKGEIEIREKLFGEEDVRLAKIYGEIGITYIRLGDYKKALTYLEYDRNTLLKLLEPDHISIAIASYNLANAKSELGFYTEAIKLYEHVLGPFKSSYGEYSEQVSMVLNALGTNSWKLDNTSEALQYYDRAAQINAAMIDELPVQGNQLEENAREYFQNNDLQKALSYFKLTQESRKKWLGESHPSTVGCYNYIAEVYAANEDYETALTTYQQAIVLFVEGFEDTSIYANPTDLSDISSEPLLLFALIGKAQNLLEKYSSTNDEIRLLKAAFETALLAHKLVNKLRAGATSSIELWSEQAALFYEDALEIAWLLFTKTGDKSLMETAFEFSESAKSIKLLQSIRGLTALSKFNLSDSLLENENELQSRISNYERFIFEEQKKRMGSCDLAKIELWENESFKLKLQLEKFILRMKETHPGYYNLKYSNEVCRIGQVQKAILSTEKRVGLLHFFEGEENIFVFVFSHHSSEFLKIGKTQDFEEKLTAFFHSLVNPALILQFADSAFRLFTHSSGYLFSQLIKPVIPYLAKDSVEHIIIVADGSLSLLPFEILHPEIKPDRQRDYGRLDYLLKTFQISYYHSATLMLEGLKMKPVLSKLPYVCFAPGYNLATDSLPPLAFSSKEAEVGRNLFGGRIFTGETATETEFRNSGRQSAILHLAMHTRLNMENANYSKLIFSKGDTTDDGLLHTHEIYNMQLPAQLSILSACETGIGKVQKGEGVINLARAFTYAGCPSILMSLWQVDDESTSEVVSGFLERIAANKDKSDAIRIAKLNYLNSADPAFLHPYYWAGMVLIGNAEPVQISKTMGGLWVWLIVGGAMIVGLVVFAMMKKVRVQRTT